MSCIVEIDINPDLPTTKKHHILFIYTTYEDGYCEGCYYIEPLACCGAVGDESFEKMHERAYESIQQAVEGEDKVPFDTTNIKNSIEFDFVQCHNMEELEAVLDYKKKGKNFKELNDII